MYLSEGKELFISNRQNGERPYRKRFPYPQKMQAFFAFRSGLHHLRKFDAAGVLLCVPLGSTVHPALLRVTKSADGFWFLRSIVTPTSKTTSRFWNNRNLIHRMRGWI